MKSKVFKVLIGLLILSVGFIAGRLFQHAQTGYHYEVREEKMIKWKDNTISWRYVTESVGLPFLDPGTTLVEVNDGIIYKAKCESRESAPYVHSVRVENDIIKWEDGDYEFALSMVELVAESPNNKQKMK